MIQRTKKASEQYWDIVSVVNEAYDKNHQATIGYISEKTGIHAATVLKYVREGVIEGTLKTGVENSKRGSAIVVYPVD